MQADERALERPFSAPAASLVVGRLAFLVRLQRPPRALHFRSSIQAELLCRVASNRQRRGRRDTHTQIQLPEEQSNPIGQVQWLSADLDWIG